MEREFHSSLPRGADTHTVKPNVAGVATGQDFCRVGCPTLDGSQLGTCNANTQTRILLPVVPDIGIGSVQFAVPKQVSRERDLWKTTYPISGQWVKSLAQRNWNKGGGRTNRRISGRAVSAGGGAPRLSHCAVVLALAAQLSLVRSVPPDRDLSAGCAVFWPLEGSVLLQ